tara:strand:- start:252 stop:443 length:192 start_codon:yes stop_codon:yes gene_type:complete
MEYKDKLSALTGIYFVKLKLYKDNPEMPEHNKMVDIMIEAEDKQQVHKIVYGTHEILWLDKVN